MKGQKTILERLLQKKDPGVQQAMRRTAHYI